MQWIVGLLMLTAGCDRVFGVEPPAGDALPSGCWDPLLTGDEDDDRVQDGCDSCPADLQTPSSMGDADGDGVGDPCDIENSPARPQRWIMFDGFHDPANTAWTVMEGVWIIENDVYRSQLATGGVVERPTPLLATYPDVEVAFSGTAGSLGTASVGVSLFVEGVLVRCMYTADQGSDRIELEVAGSTTSTDFDSPNGIRLRLFQDESERFHCEGRNNLRESDDIRIDASLMGSTATRIGLFAKSTAASFEWVSLVGLRE